MNIIKGFPEKLKKRYQVTTLRQLVLILLTFSMAGFTLLAIKDFVQLFDKPDFGLKIVQFICINMPLYYIFLIIYALILGQMNFFRPFVNKSLGRLITPFKLLYSKIK
ncbi:MAG: hypothetical protein GVY19_01210 [Bacteroidetes bacterium]|jgi:hypothetical protein|nr:hypothetical protein [Bacteroidota bacterium]